MLLLEHLLICRPKAISYINILYIILYQIISSFPLTYFLYIQERQQRRVADTRFIGKLLHGVWRRSKIGSPNSLNEIQGSWQIHGLYVHLCSCRVLLSPTETVKTGTLQGLMVRSITCVPFLSFLDWVFQCDAPSSAADFVHRCGRTARIGNRGTALAFLLPNEKEPYVQSSTLLTSIKKYKSLSI